jgi:hypothetical protein
LTVSQRDGEDLIDRLSDGLDARDRMLSGRVTGRHDKDASLTLADQFDRFGFRVSTGQNMFRSPFNQAYSASPGEVLGPRYINSVFMD